MGRRRQDVEFLAAVRAVAVAEQAELLEHVERPVDGRGDGPGIDRPAAFDQLGARHVAVGASEDVDEDPSLRRPAEAASVELVADIGPGDGRRRFERSRSGHRAKG